MTEQRIAAVQLESRIGRKAANKRRAEKAIRRAAGEGAKLICLPEAILTSGDILEVSSVASAIPGPDTEWLHGLARELDIHLVAGLLERADGGEFYSTSVIVAPVDGLVGVYRRVHLHELERRYISAGESYPHFDLPMGRVGLMQGYDLNFSDCAAAHLRADVDIIVCSALIPATYAYVAEARILVRAMDAECLFVFASGVGTNLYAGFSYMGRTQIVADPLYLDWERCDFMDGEERFAVLDEEEGTVHVDIDFERMRRYYSKASLRTDAPL